ncbi:GNAT family N-acetyltransferase [uncultured Microscilla sp.]|uniref:GNAT family N-acetyltransferase n=1 Tax=uncultured Microscilla sp. TaxID=432653 RepID=UPI002632D118|nr:GNAT family N-acetyltransferase [uncultured Microscilla sp.]
MIELKQAKTKEDFEVIEQIAHIVMPEAYKEIVKPDHLRSFLYNYQTVEAITRQVNEENYAYYLLSFQGKVGGYLGIEFHAEHIHLSKIYVLKEFRGKKLAKTALGFIDQIAREKGLNSIDLFVHIQNTGSIEVYKKLGYTIVETLDNNYGDGYIEKEYKMVKTLV